MARLTMGTIKEILRLRFKNNLSYRLISHSTEVPKSTALDYCTRFRFTKLSYKQALLLSESEIEKKLFPGRKISSKAKHPLPDFKYISREIRKKGVTLLLLWKEYKENNPESYNGSSIYKNQIT